MNLMHSLYDRLVRSGQIYLYACFFVFTLMQPLLAQHRLSGRVTDAESGESLQYANVWVESTHSGTTTDRYGRFVLPLSAGTHIVVVSYIGYKSRKRSVNIPQDDNISITLQPGTVELPTVTVTPADNPALRIIRKAIEMKKYRKSGLSDYSLTSHSKLLLRLTGADRDENSTSADNDTSSVNTEVGTDSMIVSVTYRQLPVILETQTQAYWAAPNYYKEVVTARKQSAFIPAQGNILISEFFVADFSQDELKFSNRVPVIGPISEAGLQSYYYRLLGTTFIDSTKIYQIEITPLRDSEPLLTGRLYIADASFALSMVDVRLNDAALPNMIDTMAFRQNFRLVDGKVWMPADIIVTASAKIPMLDIGLHIEGFSVLQDYRINSGIDKALFDRTRIKILTDADEKDSVYWAETQKIPNSDEDLRAYKISDSLKAVLDSSRYAVTVTSVLLGGVTGSEQAEVRYPGLFSLYSFNRVTGHALSGSFALAVPSIALRTIEAGAGYGFSDRKLKYNLSARFQLFSSPVLNVGVERFYTLDYRGSAEDPASEELMTLLSWFDKYDFRDFFYKDGWRSWLQYDPFLLFPLNISLSHQGFYNASKNTEWSVFNRNRSYRDNPAVNEGHITTVSATVSLDVRDLMDNAGHIFRIGPRNHIPAIGVDFHRIDLPSASWDVFAVKAGLSGTFDFGIPGVLSYALRADHADAALPIQLLYDLRGGMQYLTLSSGFRTLEFHEFGGDSRAVASFNYSFRDWLFRWLGVPLLRNTGWSLDFFASSGWTTMSTATSDLLTVPITEARRPFWEAGIGIDDILAVFRVELAWRLSHFRDKRNFFIGIGTSVLL